MAFLSDLPSEILHLIFERLSTAQLLPVSLTSRCLGQVVAQVVMARIRKTYRLPNRSLVIECYPESARLSTPSLAGRIARVLRDGAEGQQGETMAGVARWYSVFEPYDIDLQWPWPRLQPLEGAALPTGDIYLEEGEEMAELTVKALVRDTQPSPRLSLVAEGVLRVSRAWLMEESSPHDQQEYGSLDDYRGLLWVDGRRDMGIQVRVRPNMTDQMPVLVGVGDLPAVTYTLEYEAFVVRSSLLLLAVEACAVDKVDNAMNALVALPPPA